MNNKFKPIPIEQLELNEGQVDWLPRNPRQWTREQLDKLKASILETPLLLEARGLLVWGPYEGAYVVIGGNMRLAALRELEAAVAPCYVLPAGLSQEKVKEIAIKDNGTFGEWDMDLLMDEWADFNPEEFWTGTAQWKPENAVQPEQSPGIPQEALPEELQGTDIAPDRYAGQFAQYIKERRVMQWGGLSDEFDGYERKYGQTLELLRFFKEIDYPLCFSTKATWWTQDRRYMELVRGQKNWNFKFSIITLDEEKAREMERGVPTPRERLDAIQRIAEADAGGATLRLRPFIIGISTPSYLDLIREAGERGATALSTEFMCVEVRSKVLKDNMPIFNRLCGFDFMEFYKKYSVSTGYLRLNRKVKEPFIRKMKEACDQAGMRFYVSDAHFKELCCNGSCCGLPETWNYSRGQFCEALQIAKKKGFVTWDDIRADIERLHNYPWGKASGFNCKSSEARAHYEGMSMADYMRWLWNNPQTGQNPYKMFEGIIRPEGKDAEGNLVYIWNGK